MNEHNSTMPGRSPTGDFENSELDALFEQARKFAPTDDQLTRMLRGVPGDSSRFRRHVVRIAGGLASAAAVIAVAWLIISPPNQPRALALSDVVAAIRAAPTVRTTYDTGEVYWSSPSRWWVYMNSDGISTVFEDLQTHEQADYDAHRGEHGAIILRTLDPRENWLVNQDRRKSHLDQFISEAEAKGKAFEDMWERKDDTEAGRAIIHLTAKEPGYAGTQECAIDARTGMMIWSRNGHSRAEYDYPTDGPRDIYDLGVPRDTPVLDWRPTGELLALRDQVIAAQSEPWGAYWMVRIEIGRHPTAQRFLTDGTRWRIDRVPDKVIETATMDDLADIASELLAENPADWRRAGQVFDTHELVILIRDEVGAPRVRQLYPQQFAQGWMYSIVSESWHCSEGVFFSFARDGRMDRLGINEQGWVGTRVREQATRFDRPTQSERWYDPAHGYRPVFYSRFEYPEASWQLRSDWQNMYVTGDTGPIVRHLPDAPAQGSETEVLKWAELRPGLWYPALRETRYLVQNPAGDWVPATDRGFSEGRVVGGHIDRPAAPFKTAPLPSTTYTYVTAVPLDNVPDECFELPEEWLTTPVETGP